MTAAIERLEALESTVFRHSHALAHADARHQETAAHLKHLTAAIGDLSGAQRAIQLDIAEIKSDVAEVKGQVHEHGQMLHEHGQMLHQHGQMLHQHGEMLRQILALLKPQK